MLSTKFFTTVEGYTMAFKGGPAPAKPGMKDQTSSNIARDGAAKSPQKSFDTKWGNRSRIGEVSGVVGHGKDGAPDASSPNPLDPTNPGKKFGRVDAAWQMRDANGQSVNNEIGKQVLAEGELTGR